jgi:hypothetical protein
MTDPWPVGAATGIGSLPGIDPVDAAAMVFGELPDLAHLPELPQRGPGADMIGRTAAMLVDLPVELVASGWTFTAHAGRDLRRARDLLAWDLDALEDAAQGYVGTLKVQAAGPWTMSAAIELPTGHAVVSDAGAARDLAESLAAGLRAHVADVAARVPGAQVIVQVDEPGIGAVLGGRVPTPSGYGTVRAVAAAVVRAGLQTVLDAVQPGRRVVHCCSEHVPFGLFRAAGADAISIDLATLTVADYDDVAAAVDAGTRLWLGVVPGTDADISAVHARRSIDVLWRELGFADEQLAHVVVPTPACGMAGASPAYARRAMSVVREVGETLRTEA